MTAHIPVLLNEVIQIINPQEGGIYVDGTFGAGNYTEAILKHANCFVYAIDQDETVRPFFNRIEKDFPNKAKLFIAPFSEIDQILQEIQVDGIVLDIGMSTMQIENASRGFSFLKDGPLDMRMDQANTLTAATIVNTFYEDQIADIIYKYGEERKARKIARAIVTERKKGLINSTLELAKIIRSVFPTRYYKIDPSTKTFQALRIFINNELEELSTVIDKSANLLKLNGVLAIVSFHALEDRIIKNKFRELCGKNEEQKDNIYGQLINEPNFCMIAKKTKPSIQEVKSNYSARSAKLRAIKNIRGLK